LHEEFFTKVNEDRLIAAIKHPKGIEQFLQTNLHVSFLQTGNISVIKRYVQLLKNANRFVFLHIEKIPGISYDREGLQFLAKFVQPTGIVTTKSSLIQLAKKEGLISIQRLFLISNEKTFLIWSEGHIRFDCLETTWFFALRAKSFPLKSPYQDIRDIPL
jgi:glycerol uptake operon antiterminator